MFCAPIFYFPIFFSVFLIILCRMETFLDLISDSPNEKMAAVLHIEQ